MVQVESIRVEYTWKDQGWGHRKGRIFLQVGQQQIDYREFGLAEHTCTTHTVDVLKQGNEAFFAALGAGLPLGVQALIGGGGGHELEISNLIVTIQYE